MIQQDGPREVVGLSAARSSSGAEPGERVRVVVPVQGGRTPVLDARRQRHHQQDQYDAAKDAKKM